MRSVRVLMITPDFPPRPGGIQVLAHRLAMHFQRSEVRVLTLDTPGAAAWDAAQSVNVRRIPAGRSHRAAILGLNAAAVAEARRYAPDVILAMHVVMAPACAVIRRTLATPVVTYLHASELPASPRLTRLAVRSSARVVAVSRYTADLAADAGAQPDRVAIIPPGVDLKPPSPTPRLERPTVLTVARVAERYKGHDVMVRALPLIRARVPDAQWVIVGDGPLLSHVRRLAVSHGVTDAIRFCGAVDDEQRDDWFNRAHVFAMPSRVPGGGRAGEGYGIVYVEAGVHGLPVVAGHAGGALDAVRHQETGVLVDASDHVEVASAISDLLIDRESAARMGSWARDRAQQLSWPKIAQRVETLVTEVAGVR